MARQEQRHNPQKCPLCESEAKNLSVLRTHLIFKHDLSPSEATAKLQNLDLSDKPPESSTDPPPETPQQTATSEKQETTSEKEAPVTQEHDHDKETPPAVDVSQIAQQVVSQIKAAEDQKAVQAALGELQDWRNGKHHVEFNPEFHENCPTCAPKLQEYVGGKVQEGIAALTREQVRELARNFKDWPPPGLEIPDGIFGRRKGRS